MKKSSHQRILVSLNLTRPLVRNISTYIKGINHEYGRNSDHVFGRVDGRYARPLIFTPRKALAALRFVFYTETRTRLLGGVITTLEIPMIWAGLTENSDLAGFLLVFGIFILMITILGLVIFPQAYMGLVESLMPKETDTNLFGWRLLGVVAVIVGTAIFNVGFNAL